MGYVRGKGRRTEWMGMYEFDGMKLHGFWGLDDDKRG